jgi:metal-responsive CopG/Arc/MetJ family transcriptional regulator
MLKMVVFRMEQNVITRLDDKLKRTQYKTRTEFLEDVCMAFLEGRLHIDG